MGRGDPYRQAQPATRPRFRPRLRRLRIPLVAAAAALGLAAALPLAGPRPPVPELVGERVADAAIPSPAPTQQPAAYVDPGPDDRRSVRDAPRPAPLATLTGYQWPLPRGRLTLPFGPSPWGSRIVAGEKLHDGVDLATFCGDRIVAAHDGTVLAAGRRFDRWLGWQGDLGPYTRRLDRKQAWSTLPIVVVIDDGNGYRSVYAHFSKVVVKRGQQVEAGQLIGYEGATGRASGCHLHYGLFSPLERATFGIEPVVVRRMKVPDRQTARVDPVLVLPSRVEPGASPPPAPIPAAPPPAPRHAAR